MMRSKVKPLERALAGLLFRICRGGLHGNPYCCDEVRYALHVLAELRNVTIPQYGTPDVLTDKDCPPGMWKNDEGFWEARK